MKRLALYALAALLLIPSCAASKTYRQGNTEQKKIAITVDDCENMDVLTEMLDLFKEQEIYVTFFVSGKALNVEDSEIWQRVLAEGHEIGNHTFGHPSLTAANMTPRKVKSQLRRTENKLNEVLGFEYAMLLMRPPYGKCESNSAKKRIQEAGYKHIVLWSVSQTDPKKALKQIQNGSICLYHTNPKDLRCLEEIIPQLKEGGYEMVTASELLGLTDR